MAPANPLDQARRALSDALTDLQTISQTPAKRRRSEVASTVDVITRFAFEHGLANDALETLVDILSQPNELDQASIVALVRNLYPASKLRSSAIIKVVGCLGHGKRKAAAPTQVALVKWIIMVYDVLESRGIVSQFYGVFFNLLDTLSIRGPLCHLLALITRRKHVRPFRIQALLELVRNVGNEPPLVGLVRVYKDYYPDVIVGEATAGRASVFSHPMPEWRERLMTIQEANEDDLDESIRGHSTFKVVRHGAKRSKISAIPEVHTSRANKNSVTLEEIESVSDFVQKLEVIELPNQAASVLSDPLLQKLLALRPSPAADQRIANWLSTFFEEELQAIDHGQHDGARLSSVLQTVLDYTKYTKQLPTACADFLQVYLDGWDGSSHQTVVLDLAAFLPIKSFAGKSLPKLLCRVKIEFPEDLQVQFFSSIEAAILDNSPGSKVQLLDFYTSLFRHWTVQLVSDSSLHFSLSIHTMAGAFTGLAQRADTLCLSIFESGAATSLQHISSILSFWEMVAAATTHPQFFNKIRITTPSSLLIYLITFTTSLMNLSRLCQILATYKRGYEGVMSATQQPQESIFSRKDIDHFNGLLMDICNCLWRNRAFNREDANAMGCLVSDSILPRLRTYADGMGHSLPTLFSLSHSATLCALSIGCFRELEDAAADDITTRHAGPVTQRSLEKLGSEGGLDIAWSDYRLEVLRWLESNGVKGIPELMYSTMKHLRVIKSGT